MSVRLDQQEKIGPCRKCQSQIPIEADRCPGCGFEPKIGILGKIFLWVALMWGATSTAIALISLAVIFDTATVQTGLTGFGVFGFFALVCFGYIRRKWELYKQKPAIQSNVSKEGEQDKNSPGIRESYERGEEIGDGIREKIDSLPSPVWTAGVLFGIALGLSSWVLAGLELINAFGIVMVASIVFLVFSIMEDIGRLNRATDLDFNWWAYALPAMVPVVGFVFGFVWLLRKRQKTGTVF